MQNAVSGAPQLVHHHAIGLILVFPMADAFQVRMINHAGVLQEVLVTHAISAKDHVIVSAVVLYINRANATAVHAVLNQEGVI